jgi:hypothetical protein
VRLAALAALAGALGAALALAPARAAAGEPPPLVRLVYALGLDTAGCPEAPAFEEAVARRLGRFPFSEYASTLLVVLIEREGAGFYGRLIRREAEGAADGAREMRLRKCPELVEALALAAAIALAPRLQAEAPPPALADEPAPAAAATAAVPTAPAPMPALAAVPLPATLPAPQAELRAARAPAAGPANPGRWPLAWEIAVAPLGDTTWTGADGLDLTPGLAISWAGVWQRFSLALEGRATAARATTADLGRVLTQHLVVGLLPCSWVRGLTACAGLSGGVLRAWGEGFDENGSTLRPYVAPGVRLGYRLGTGRLRVRPYAALEVPLLRYALTVEGGPVVRQKAVTAWMGLQLGWQLR